MPMSVVEYDINNSDTHTHKPYFVCISEHLARRDRTSKDEKHLRKVKEGQRH